MKGEGLKLCIMKPKIVSWNVKGLNEKETRLRIRGLLKDWKADIICLLETKLENISSEMVWSLWCCQHVGKLFMGLRGDSSRILLIWDGQVVEKIEDCVGSFTVACSFRTVKDNLFWAFVGGVWSK